MCPGLVCDTAALSQDQLRLAAEPIARLPVHSRVFALQEKGPPAIAKPRSVRGDDGSAFAGRRLDQSAYLDKIGLDFSRPGKPSDHADIEAFTGRLRQECLDASWFLSMGDARARIEAWRTDCSRNRPHAALGGSTAAGSADQLKPARKVA